MDLVTITFEEEYDLLKLQAASVAKFVHNVNKIHIISNSDVDLSFIKPYYGKYQNNVKIHYWYDFDWNIDNTHYDAQQVLKCLATDVVETDWYVLLDTKNFFIRNHILAKPLASLYGRQGFAFRPKEKLWWENICKFFEVDSSNLPLLYSTPFFTNKQIMQDMVYCVEKHSGLTLNDYFTIMNMHEDTRVLEFFLYSAYMLREHAYADKYTMVDRFVSSVWPGTVDMKHCQVGYLQTDNRLFASGIHRNAYPIIDIHIWKKYLCHSLELLDEQEFDNIVYKRIAVSA